MEEIRNRELSDGVMFKVTGGVAGYEDYTTDQMIVSGSNGIFASGGGIQVISGGSGQDQVSIHSGGIIQMS